MSDNMEPGIVNFRYFSSSQVVKLTQEQAAHLVRTGQGSVLGQGSFNSQPTPFSAYSQASTIKRVYASVSNETFQELKLQISSDRTRFSDPDISIADVLATLVSLYGQGKITLPTISKASDQ